MHKLRRSHSCMRSQADIWNTEYITIYTYMYEYMCICTSVHVHGWNLCMWRNISFILWHYLSSFWACLCCLLIYANLHKQWLQHTVHSQSTITNSGKQVAQTYGNCFGSIGMRVVGIQHPESCFVFLQPSTQPARRSMLRKVSECSWAISSSPFCNTCHTFTAIAIAHNSPFGRPVILVGIN